MGKGGKGKGVPGFGPGPHHHRHHRGPGLGMSTAGAAMGGAVLGVVAGAAVASAVAQPARRCPPPRPAPTPAPVVVVGSAGSALPPVVVVPAPKAKAKGKGKGTAPPVVITEQPLAVQWVHLVPEATETRGTVTFFCIEVLPEGGGQAWRVMRRYNEFLDLQTRLAGKEYPDAPFPKKCYFGCTGEKLDNRRNGLQAWIQRTVQDPASRTQWARPLRDFLEAGRQFITLNSQPDLVPEASAPAMEATEEGQVLQVRVPDGVTGGQLIAITVPGGKELTVEVPQGMASGAELQLWYEPAADQLVPMT